MTKKWQLKCKVKKFDRKYDWPQQFETSTGDKTHTGNILPRGNKPCPRQKIRRGNQPNIKSAPMIQKKMGLHHKNAPGLKMNPTVYQAWLLNSPMGPPKTEMYDQYLQS